MTTQSDQTSIWLASGSAARRQLLTSAGISFQVKAPDVDEPSIKQTLRSQGASSDEVALALADTKAANAAGDIACMSAIVIGADQMLACDGELFDKPASRAEAAAQLMRLRGRWHVLHSAVVIRRGGKSIWRHVSHPCLKMRVFSENWLNDYLDAEGEALFSSVGAYRLEGIGRQLFEQIEGDHSAILGLPMSPLLDFLRQAGAIKG